MMTRAQTAVCTAVSPMSGSSTFDIDKKKQKRGEFKTPPRPTGRRSNYGFRPNYPRGRRMTGYLAGKKHFVTTRKLACSARVKFHNFI